MKSLTKELKTTANNFGIAYSLDKHVILLSHQTDQLPIDVRTKRFLIFKDLNQLQQLLREELLSLPS
jgi:hypothetical protein